MKITVELTLVPYVRLVGLELQWNEKKSLFLFVINNSEMTKDIFQFGKIMNGKAIIMVI